MASFQRLSAIVCAALALAVWFSRPVSASEIVHFDSAIYPPSPFKVKQAEARGLTLEPRSGVTIAGNLYRPEGEGSFPAVILMHGCPGIGRWNHVWRRRLLDWGYVVLDVDSFGPRGIEGGVCTRAAHLGPLSRALDAHGAKSYLTTLPFVAPGRIGIMGMSHGGMSALQAVGQMTTARIDAVPFRAAVALYPVCEVNTEPNAPILILIGEQDMWVDAKYCERYLEKFGTGYDVSLKVYPGVHHVFDIEGTEFWGLQYDRDAAEDAKTKVRLFLDMHLK